MALKLPFRIFKTPKHQRFEYHPRHWDPDKEERENRMARIKSIQEEGNIDGVKARISTGLRRGGQRDAEYRSKMVKQANLRLLFVLIAVIIISAVLIWIFLPDMIAALLG